MYLNWRSLKICLVILILLKSYILKEVSHKVQISFAHFYKSSFNTNGIRKLIDDDMFIKSKIDKAKYRYLKLDNGLKVYIVSKEEISHSEVAISVGVGFLYDPIEINGLSNLVQHSLLLSSKEYPNINEFHNFIKSLNGKIYLDLHPKSTIYSLIIGTEYLSETLFRFSSYFRNPLLNKETINKALLTIFDLIDRFKTNEKWIRTEIEREVCGLNSSFNRCIYGNKNTFLNNPNLKQGEIYEKVLEYFENYYTPNIMTLSIVGREPLDKLQKYVVRNFKLIKNQGINIIRMEDNYKFMMNPFIQLRKKIIVIKKSYATNINTFTLRFPIEFQVMYWKKIPTLYIKYLLDSNFKGILRRYLKKIDISTLIKVFTVSFEGFSTLDIMFELHNGELCYSWDIVKAIISTIKFIIEEPVNENLLHEIKKVTGLIFNYTESDFTKDLAYNIVYKSQKYKLRPEEIIYAGEIIKIIDVQLIQSFLKSIDIENVVILFSTPTILLKKSMDKNFRSNFYPKSNQNMNLEDSHNEHTWYEILLWIYDAIKHFIIKILSFVFKKEIQIEDFLIKKYEKKDIDQNFNEITEKNKFVECNKLLKSKYLFSEYCINQLPSDFFRSVQSLNSVNIQKIYLLDLVTPNPYIPVDLSFQPKHDENNIIPQPLLLSIKKYLEKTQIWKHNEKFEFFSNILYFYYKNDIIQNPPQTSLMIRIQTPVIDSNIKNVPKVLKVVPRLVVSIELLCSMLKISLEDDIFDFEVTKNEFEMTNFNNYFYNGLPNGFEIILKGFYDVISIFLIKFANYLTRPKKYLNSSHFNQAYKEIYNLLTRYAYDSSSTARSISIMRSMTENQPLSPYDRLNELKYVRFEDIIELSEFLSKKGQIEGLFMNNINPLKAGNIINEFLTALGREKSNFEKITLKAEKDKIIIEDYASLKRQLKNEAQSYNVDNMLVPLSNVESEYFNFYQILDLTSLPNKFWKSYIFEYSSDDESNSVVSLSMTIGTKTPFTMALATLTNIFLSDLISKFLKKHSIENENAMVFSPTHYSSLLFVIIQINSYSKDIIYLSELLFAFLDELFENLFIIEKNNFYKTKRDCITKFRELPNNIELFTRLFFTFVEGTEYPYQWIERVINSLEVLSFEKFLRFLKILYKTPQIMVAIQSKNSKRPYRVDGYIPKGFTGLNTTNELLNQDNLYIYKLPINTSRNILPDEDIDY